MKKNLFIAAILCGSCICANAASMVTEWTGNAGPTEGNTYELGNADNWSNGVPARGNNQGPDVIVNNTGTITLSGSMVDTSDGGSITVTGNSNVTVGGTRWTGNVTIGAGSALSLSQVDFKSSDIILDGTFNLGVCGIDSGGNGARLVFGIGGIMNVNQKIWGASDFSVSGTLATTSTDLAAGEFQFVTRTLITSAGFDGGSISLGDFTAEHGGALTKASGIMEGNAADYQGQYYLYTEDGNVQVQYVVAGAVTEPDAAPQARLTVHTLSFFLNSLYAHAYRLFYFQASDENVTKNIFMPLPGIRSIFPLSPVRRHANPRKITQRTFPHTHLSDFRSGYRLFPALRGVPLGNVSAH